METSLSFAHSLCSDPFIVRQDWPTLPRPAGMATVNPGDHSC